ncbi:MAG: peptidoglycan-binding protein [Candidatus Rokubacteria bacterium]|nr:peptidoglycan-binding protein [Candidatus Rokubacteria bacterium]
MAVLLLTRPAWTSACCVSPLTAIAILVGGLFGLTSGLESSDISQASFPRVTRERSSPAPAPRFLRDTQKALRDLGHQPGPIDGVVGPRTRAALMSYQRAEGLPATGRLETETMARLDIHERLFRRTSHAPRRAAPIPAPAAPSAVLALLAADHEAAESP